MADGKVFLCGNCNGNVLWTPQLLNTKLAIREIYALGDPVFISDTHIHQMTISGKRDVYFIPLQKLNIEAKIILKSAFTTSYILKLIRENNENSLYIWSKYENKIRKSYNLGWFGFQKVPITDVLDISNCGNIILTKSKLYLFNDNIRDSIFSNLLRYDQYVEMSDLNNDIDDDGKFVATPFLQRLYNWTTSNTTDVHVF